MRAGRHSRRMTHVALAAVAALLLVGGLLLEQTLVRATIDARATLQRTVVRASSDPLDDASEVEQHLDRGAFAEAAALLTARAETSPSAATRTLAAEAATAAGRFDEAARHATFAWRLSPGDAALDAHAKHAATLALWGRLRPAARFLALAGLLVLTVGWLRARRRRRRRKKTASWVASLQASVGVGVDGRASSAAALAALTPATQTVVLDIFLRPRGRSVRPPRPGPTLAVVLSHAASGLTLRLRPRHDVRDDAVRIRLTNETLTRMLERHGRWRMAILLAGHTVDESRLDVAARATLPRPRRMHLVGQA